MEPIGTLDDGITKTAYYSIRYNRELGYMSNKPKGLQAMINYLGTMTWINIKQSWLTNGEAERAIKLPKE